MTVRIINLFPTPLYRSLMKLSFSKDQIKYISKKYTEKNPLDLKIFKNIKQELEQASKHCLTETLLVNEKVKIKISNSFFDFCLNGESKINKLYNSYYTGVYCFQAFRGDEITFFKNEYTQIKILPTLQTTHNSFSWKIPMYPGELYIFPSWLTFFFNKRENQLEDRIILYFNTYIENIGKKEFNRWMTDLDDKKELMLG